MKKLVDLVKLVRLDSQIRHASTGTPEELAERLEMSRSSLFELLSFLKEEMRAPIIYNRYRPSYTYSYTPRFYLGFEREHLGTAIESTNPCSDGEISENLIEKKNKKVKVEIEIDDDGYILDDDKMKTLSHGTANVSQVAQNDRHIFKKRHKLKSSYE